MKIAYERIFELMGRDNDDPLFTHFVRDLGETPKIADGGAYATGYSFPRSGLSLILLAGRFERAVFELVSNQSPYTGSLPAGIHIGDNRQDVQRKLGLAPLCRAQGQWEAYDLTPVQVDFCFSDSAETVKLMMIAYTPLGQDLA